MHIEFDLTEHEDMQDLVRSISKSTNLPPVEAIKEAITEKNFVTVLDAGYGDIALGLWGHGNGFEFTPLEDPVIILDLSEEKAELVERLMEADESIENEGHAVFLFLIFEAAALGYHI